MIIIKYLPMWVQARIALCLMKWKYKGTSHIRINTLKALRKMSGCTLKEAKDAIDAIYPYPQ